MPDNIGSGIGLVPSGTKPLPDLMLTYVMVKWIIGNKLKWNFDQSTTFLAKNIFENVVCHGTAMSVQVSFD